MYNEIDWTIEDRQNIEYMFMIEEEARMIKADELREEYGEAFILKELINN